MKAENIWGLLFDFCFVVDKNENGEEKYKLDKVILIASGTMNSKGGSNFDFYLFKYSYLQSFIQNYVPKLNHCCYNPLAKYQVLIAVMQAPQAAVLGHNKCGIGQTAGWV